VQQHVSARFPLKLEITLSTRGATWVIITFTIRLTAVATVRRTACFLAFAWHSDCWPQQARVPFAMFDALSLAFVIIDALAFAIIDALEAFAIIDAIAFAIIDALAFGIIDALAFGIVDALAFVVFVAHKLLTIIVAIVVFVAFALAFAIVAHHHFWERFYHHPLLAFGITFGGVGSSPHGSTN